MGYEIVPYTPDLDDEIAALQKHLLGADVVLNARYQRWKYFDNPYFDEPLLYLARCDGRVIGMRGMMGTAWEVGEDGSRHLLPYADDLVIVPEHRNQGVVAQIMKAAIDDLARRGHPFAINLSAGPVTYVASLALGWRSAGSFEPVQLGRRSAPSPAAARSVAARLPWLRTLVRRLRAQRSRGLFDRLDRGLGTGPTAITLSRSPRSEAMAALVAGLPWDGRLRHVRDRRYFDWRFRNPLHEYRFLYAGGEDLRGYLVLQRYRSERADLERVNIVDWEAADDEVRAELLAAALRWGQFGRVHAWLSGVPEAARSLLVRHGFEPEADAVRVRHQGLLVRRIGTADDPAGWSLGGRSLLAIEDWDLRLLYSMAG